MTKESSLIFKSANRFRVGEVLHLFGAQVESFASVCGLLSGPFVIMEVKHQSSEGVTFILRPAYPALPGALENGYQPYTKPPGTLTLEFRRTAELCRMRGVPLTYVIEETP